MFFDQNIYVAMATRVPVQSAPKQYATFSAAQLSCVYNLIKIHPLALEILNFECFPTEVYGDYRLLGCGQI